MTKIIKERTVYIVVLRHRMGYEAHVCRDEKVAKSLEKDPTYIKTIKTTVDEAV